MISQRDQASDRSSATDKSRSTREFECREDNMLDRSSIGSIALAAALLMTIAEARAFDENRYPELKGQWQRIGAPRWDADKAPLTREYRAIYEANLADMATGGQGFDPTYTCLAPGMPRVMNAYEPMEIIVTPDTTYVLIDHIHDSRRIYTDGRDWPEEIEPTFAGYSIGKWHDEDGDGRFDLLEVETRAFKGPRAYDSTGLPLHTDNQTVIKERIYLDKADRNILHDEITVIDHALTQPWTMTRNYRHEKNPQPVWRETICAENNQHVGIGSENYFIGADGLLMPTKKDQTPPDLRYFKQWQR
jgi:hypothetical protein